MKSKLQSKIAAIDLAFAVAMPLTVAGSGMFARPAEAGVLGSIKSAAKNTAKGFVEVGKVAGGMVKTSAKGVGVLVKDGASAVSRGVEIGRAHV